jgi:hypothetical protein
MVTGKKHNPLTEAQVQQLQSQGCCAQDWSGVTVADDFDPAKVHSTTFLGTVQIGTLTGSVAGPHGLQKPCGIYNATLANCTIGDGTRIANVGVHLANYTIGDHVSIEDIGTMHTDPGAAFGNGVEVDVLNEAGGREVILFDELSVQFAYLMCLHRYRPEMIKKLKSVAMDYAASVKSDIGTVGNGTVISSVDEIVDTRLGAYATINGASSLINGTILSTQDAPTQIGSEVIAKDFIIAESSSVTSGAVLEQCFVGQGCQIGKQFSAENCLFFANCEAFHGEGCSAFCGPYSVTHHKSTLLIAAMFSFYNAGSGTNQSNHMYKLGPVHEGKVLRGTKTGSFSYLMWPCRVGPFSVVLGKHTSTFDTADYPFSHLAARSDGKCAMVPGLHLTTVGTVRDGAKWPKRDRRKGSIKRDILSFDVFSPYTVGQMIKASANLKAVSAATDKSVDEVSIGGAIVKRLILRTGQKYYKSGIHMYLLEKVVEKAEQAVKSGAAVSDFFATSGDAVFSDEWVDVGGQLMPQQRLIDLHNAIESGSVASVEAFATATEKIAAAYSADEWVWVKNAYQDVFGVNLDTATLDHVVEIAQTYLAVKSKFLKLVVLDAKKEFAELSQCGFGQDGVPDDIANDFKGVRGTYEGTAFVNDMNAAIADFKTRIEAFVQTLSNA